MSFQRLFKALNTFKMLSPLAGYIDGNFNTSLIMDGTLGKDLMPKLASLNVQGFLETLNGYFQFQAFSGIRFHARRALPQRQHQADQHQKLV